MNQKSNDLKERLIRFSILVSDIVELLPGNRIGKYIADQLTRSGISPSFNYGEAQFAESANDFIHKIKICLKELNEVHICLLFIGYKSLIDNINIITQASGECNELISIFVATVETKRKNMQKDKQSLQS